MDSTEVVKYGWVEAKVVGILSVLNIEVSIEVVGIVVDDPQGLSVLLVGPKKRICNSFDDCAASLYESLFTRIGLWLPIFDFEVVILKNLKVSPSHPHPRSWAYIRVFQLCIEHKS